MGPASRRENHARPPRSPRCASRNFTPHRMPISRGRGHRLVAARHVAHFDQLCRPALFATSRPGLQSRPTSGTTRAFPPCSLASLVLSLHLRSRTTFRRALRLRSHRLGLSIEVWIVSWLQSRDCGIECTRFTCGVRYALFDSGLYFRHVGLRWPA